MWKIILLCILLFILLLLSIKVSLLFQIENEEYQLVLKILFYKKKLFSSQDEEKEPSSSKQPEEQFKSSAPAEQKQVPAKTGQQGIPPDRKEGLSKKQSYRSKSGQDRVEKESEEPSVQEKQSIFEKIEMILDFIRPLPEPFKKLIRRFHVTNLRIYIRVSEENAAETAISYGKIWGIVSGCLAVCRNILKIQLKSCRIEPDFWQQKPITRISGQLNLRIYAALAFILRYLWLYLKQTIQKSQTEKGGVLNESTSNRGNVRHIHGKNQGND